MIDEVYPFRLELLKFEPVGEGTAKADDFMSDIFAALMSSFLFGSSARKRWTAQAAEDILSQFGIHRDEASIYGLPINLSDSIY